VNYLQTRKLLGDCFFKIKNKRRQKLWHVRKIKITDFWSMIPFRFVSDASHTATLEQKQSLPGRTKQH